MTDYAHHYKDREPEETIKIIENFFKEKEISIKKIQAQESEIGTFSCRYSLVFNNIPFLAANGKGMTEIYSKASCYAELYERFCGCRLHNNGNPFFTTPLWEKRFKEKHYYLHPDEKELSLDELLKDNYAQKYFPKNFNKQLLKIWADTYQQGKVLGIPYYTLDHQFDCYRNFNIIISAEGTNGLATGNTLEEALVQGCCELYERKTIYQFYNEPQDKYYYLKTNCLPKELQEKVYNIQKQGYNCYIYDLSYNFHMPVCMIFILNQITHKFYIDFGSGATFNIAVERCITEIYQGFISITAGVNVKTLPYKHKYLSEAFLIDFKTIGGINYNSTIYLPAFLFEKSEELNTYNKECYFNSNISVNNIELLNFLKDLNNKNNIKILYTDISLSPDIYTVSIIFDEQKYLINKILNLKAANLDFMFIVRNFYEQLALIQDNQINKEKITNCVKYLYRQNSEVFTNIVNRFLYPYICNGDYNKIFDYMNILHLLNNENDKIIFMQTDTMYTYKYNEYMLYQTLVNEEYNKDEIQYIFKELNYQNQEKIAQLSNNEDLLQFIFIDTIQEFYQSDTYNKFINLFV